LIRAESGDAEQELADWWDRFMEAGEAEREAMLKPAQGTDAKRKRRKRHKPTDASPSESGPD
jgi:poly(A) polymerase